MVEEACSGVQSLFTLIFIATFIGVFRLYTVPRTLFLTASSVFWALLMNVFRVVTITIAQTEFDTDLGHGWQHDLVGYLGIGAAILFLLSTDRLLLFFLAGLPDDALKHKTTNFWVTFWNWLFVSAPLESAGRQTILPNGPNEKHLLRSRQLQLACCVLVASFIAGLPAYRTLRKPDDTDTQSTAFLALSGVDSEWLDVGLIEGCTLQSFETERRERESQFGEYSNKWMTIDKSGNVLHSMDHTFDGWHDLSICYRNIGWRMDSINHIENASGDWPVVFAEFIKPTGEHAYLCYSLFTTSGQPMIPSGAGVVNGIRARLLHARRDERKSIQVQSLAASLVAWDKQSIAEFISRHHEIRDQLLCRVSNDSLIPEESSGPAPGDSGK